MTPTLANFVRPRGRFRRSVRLDASSGAVDQLAGYLPTARSLEVIRRLQRAMAGTGSGRAMSITGPYGSGKSSLALFLDALCGSTTEPAFKEAVSILKHADPVIAAEWLNSRRAFGARTSGFIRAVITTPQREPITTTVLRALQRGAARAHISSDLKSELDDALTRAESRAFATPSYGEIRDLLVRLTQRKPMILIIDEFGKNLEAFAESGNDGDLYLLQELAEWAGQIDGVPLLLVTIQHLAFDTYVGDATTAQRREWSKVQGRFEDIPFVDSPSATRQLIRASLEQDRDPEFQAYLKQSVTPIAESAKSLGHPDVSNENLIRACFPIHPSTLLVLPDLCARFGQNERTLFSFVTSDEANSVVTTLSQTPLNDPDPWVRLDQVYDYFVSSAGTFVGASSEATRWIEVETTIRDAPSLSALELRTLKTVGILNLVSGRSSITATREMVRFALGLDASEISGALTALTSKGLVVYREFAGEFRIWRGSDFDIASALERARRQSGQRPIADLLEEVLPLGPVVAARHSIRTGTTRSFARVYAVSQTSLPNPDLRHDRTTGLRIDLQSVDGLLIYNVDPEGLLPEVPNAQTAFPVVVITPNDRTELVRTALELDALLAISSNGELGQDDVVAVREIKERVAYARQHLDHAVADAFDEHAQVTWVNATDGPRVCRAGNKYLSEIFDDAYSEAPSVRNETINRTQLTSQGARARRDVVAAMIDPRLRAIDRLGLTGDGPEVSIYHALLHSTGIHRNGDLHPPSSSEWLPAWDLVTDTLYESLNAPIAIHFILNQLANPPYGVRQGPALILLIAGLVANRSSIAIYEHGTYRPVLDAPLTERMMKNPGNFSVKYLAAGKGTQRDEAVSLLATELAKTFPNLPTATRALQQPTVLTVTLALVSVIQQRDDKYTRTTSRFLSRDDQRSGDSSAQQAAGVRDALLAANEPDQLLFHDLPQAVGLGPLPASGKGRGSMSRVEIADFARAVAGASMMIWQTREHLCELIIDTTLRNSESPTVEELGERARDLDGIDVIPPDVRRLAQLVQMRALYTDDVSWMSAVTEAVCGGSFLHWTDDTLPRHLDTLSATAADLARMSNLARFRQGKSEGAFRAYHLQATADDGATLKRIVTLPNSMKADTDAAVKAAYEALAGLGVESRREVRDYLLAALLHDATKQEPEAEVAQFTSEERETS